LHHRETPEPRSAAWLDIADGGRAGDRRRQPAHDRRCRRVCGADLPAPQPEAPGRDSGGPIIEPFEYTALAGAELRHWWFRLVWEELRHWRRQLPQPRLRLLDLGCGTGGALRFLTAGEEPELAVGLDASPLALLPARERCSADLVQADAGALPFRNAGFDLITSVDVLYTRTAYPKFDQILSACYQLLRPGGLLVLQLPALRGLWSDHDVNVHGMHRFSRREVRAALAAAGFANPHVYYRLGCLVPAAWLMRRLGGVHQGESHVQVPPRWANALAYWWFACEGVLARRGWLPLGVSVFAVAQRTQ